MKNNFTGLKNIENVISNLLGPIASKNNKKYNIISNLVKNWPDIVGKKYCEFCQPNKISFTKDSGNIKLTISAFNSATGFFLKNNSEILIERIASFYGYKAIYKIHIKQEPKMIVNNQSKILEISKNKQEFVNNVIQNIDDNELKNKLRNLASYVFNSN